MNIVFIILLSVTAPADPPIPKLVQELQWSNQTPCSKPESVYYEPNSQRIFISNISGKSDVKDGDGWISMLDKDGKILKPQWVKGLNAPKGMRSVPPKLLVTDIDELVTIDIPTGKIDSRLKIPEAKFLNDIAIDPATGTAYVSDTMTSTIYSISHGSYEVFVQGKQFDSPNGLLVTGDRLVVASWGFTTDWTTQTPGKLYSILLKTKDLIPISPKPLGNLDGLEIDASGQFLVSDWVAGKVYRVSQDGTPIEILSGFKGAADIGFISDIRVLIVPRMDENKISAYQLNF